MIRKSRLVRFASCLPCFILDAHETSPSQVCAILGALKKSLKSRNWLPWILAKANEYFQGRDFALTSIRAWRKTRCAEKLNKFQNSQIAILIGIVR